MFYVAKEIFAVRFKDLAHRATSDAVDLIVGVKKFPTQFVGDTTTNRALAGTHQTH